MPSSLSVHHFTSLQTIPYIYLLQYTAKQSAERMTAHFHIRRFAQSIAYTHTLLRDPSLVSAEASRTHDQALADIAYASSAGTRSLFQNKHTIKLHVNHAQLDLNPNPLTPFNSYISFNTIQIPSSHHSIQNQPTAPTPDLPQAHNTTCRIQQ
jgi:hypothetical protein